jgi:hypothetical protein
LSVSIMPYTILGSQEMMEEGPVEVYSALNITEAEFLRGLLANEGIDAKVVGEALGMGVGELPPLIATPRIWVQSSEVERARTVIDEYGRRLAARATKTSPAERPYCYYCGQTVNLGQSPCPACGQELAWSSAEDER